MILCTAAGHCTRPCFLPALPCSPVTIIAALGRGPTMGTVCVTPPTAGGPWVTYKCTPCYKGTCLAAQPCSTPVRRRQLLAPAGCDNYPGTTQCNLDTLESVTLYE